jgi:hypothetical protein
MTKKLERIVGISVNVTCNRRTCTYMLRSQTEVMEQRRKQLSWIDVFEKNFEKIDKMKGNMMTLSEEMFRQ